MEEEKSLSLYSISKCIRELEAKIIENSGEIDEQTETLIEGLGIELTRKTDGVVSWLNELLSKNRSL